jgi:hypothetical protein
MMQPALASKVHSCGPMAWLGWIRGRHKDGRQGSGQSEQERSAGHGEQAYCGDG